MLLAVTFSQLWMRTYIMLMFIEIKMAPTSSRRRISNMCIKFHENTSTGCRVQVPYAEWWTEQICLTLCTAGKESIKFEKLYAICLMHFEHHTDIKLSSRYWNKIYSPLSWRTDMLLPCLYSCIHNSTIVTE